LEVSCGPGENKRREILTFEVANFDNGYNCILGRSFLLKFMAVIEHRLGIDPAFNPIKQKEKRYTPERCETVRVEVNKLLEAKFIRLVDYPSWLANPVIVEKPNGSWCMCID
jgi:hypothetical protein